MPNILAKKMIDFCSPKDGSKKCECSVKVKLGQKNFLPYEESYVECERKIYHPVSIKSI